MKHRLIMRGDFLSKLQDYFFPSPEFDLEGYAVIFLAPARGKDFVTLLPVDIWLAEPEDYIYRTKTSLQMTDAFVSRCNMHCVENNYSIMMVHSHPFDKRNKNFFSGVDNACDYDGFWFFRQLVPNGYFVPAVMNRNRHISFRFFICSSREMSAHTFDEVLYVDMPLRKEFPAEKKDGRADMDMGLYDRQIRVFGKEGQKLMAMMRVCIVGVGGLGSVLVEILARLGVREFILIDHDIAEWTNLNRFTGMYRYDVEKKRFKVRIARRLIRMIDPDAKVTCITDEVYSSKAIKRMKDADIIFLGTDNITSRDFVNTFSIQYLIPLVSMGSVINFNVLKKKIINILGEIVCVLPGSSGDKYCLRCLGAVNTDHLKLENAPGNLRERIGGYILNDEEPAPAVRYVNGLVCDFAAAEFHNLVCNFKEPALYQKLNLMPRTSYTDTFIAEDYENFFDYLIANNIIKSDDEELKRGLLNAFTVVDKDGSERTIKKGISQEAFQQISQEYSQKGFIEIGKEEEFLYEISNYFVVTVEKECEIIDNIDVCQDEDDCTICGPMGFIMGQGDLAELKKFAY